MEIFIAKIVLAIIGIVVAQVGIFIAQKLGQEKTKWLKELVEQGIRYAEQTIPKEQRENKKDFVLKWLSDKTRVPEGVLEGLIESELQRLQANGWK